MISTGGAVVDGLVLIDGSPAGGSLGTLVKDVAAVTPTVSLDTSAAFLANTWQTVWSKTLTEGLTGTFQLDNGLISTGTAGTAACSQVRLYSCYRRVMGGSAQVPVGSSGIQTSGISGTQIRLNSSGNDIQLQMLFTNAATYFYKLNFFLNERQI